MIVLAGADIVLTDQIITGGSLSIVDGIIERIDRFGSPRPGATVIDLSGHTIAPGFVDVHVHGLEGTDVLDGPDAVANVAARLPKYGVTGFCPTSIACTPERLNGFLEAVDVARKNPTARSAQVHGAHLESNFINPEWSGAQPIACLRTPRAPHSPDSLAAFSGEDILRVIAKHRTAVGIVTLAPELPGGVELVRDLVKHGHRVSIGHSGATYEQARAAIDAGARHATHLFNRMSSMTSRAPGVVGAVLESNAVTAEIICDGHHVHPSLVSTAVRIKSASRMIAITDGTALAGLPRGSRGRLGDQTIVAGERTALLEDGTLAGSLLTMDGAFRMLRGLGWTLPEVARMCATTPAGALGLPDTGAIVPGHRADLVVLDAEFRVRQTYIGGETSLQQ
ncbi:MAG: N-acetylglucosamine-6-phosphate deacetylase [Vicinamibacterales bacterium]